MPSAEELKRTAAERAVERVQSGMRLGLGTGSTVAHFLDVLAERLRSGALKNLIGVPTSVRTAERSRELGIPLAELHEGAPLDLTVDGADEVDPSLDLIKGLGGALLREKIVAWSANKLVICVDPSKLVQRIGEKFALPIEVLPFAWPLVFRELQHMGGSPVLRAANNVPALTDNGNNVIDCSFPSFAPLAEMDAKLNAIPGVIGHGLFLGMTTSVVVGYPDGRTEILGEQP